jgi:hypothetical protein
MIGFPRFWDASFPMRSFYRSHPRKAVRQSTSFGSERASSGVAVWGMLRIMKHASAGEGNSPSTSLDQQSDLPVRTERDERCAYGRLVARELAALGQSDDDSAEQQSLRARVRRWCVWPQRGGNLPAAGSA